MFTRAGVSNRFRSVCKALIAVGGPHTFKGRVGARLVRFKSGELAWVVHMGWMLWPEQAHVWNQFEVERPLGGWPERCNIEEGGFRLAERKAEYTRLTGRVIA